MSNYRPDPDELLKQIHKSEGDSKRGKLKIFFGMCPGVGKTFAMLKAAHEQKANGVKVLAGLIETHQRLETENLLKDFDLLPRKTLQYKNTNVTEFDLDNALLSKPDLILVDELAHTNVPGSRHPKRYQDIEELLHAGIDVYTTLNVQHIESRIDLVYQITGVPVRESVPDGFLEKANEIEIIDISPEKLLKRLREGKVYLGDRAERAAQNFFKEESLIALRELALRFTAEMVDERLRDQMTLKGIAGPWNTNERLMVAISHSPLSKRLIRATRRMAYNLEAPWVALYVDQGRNLNIEDEQTLKKNLNSARELGAEVITRKDVSVMSALVAVAREKNVTQIVMGRPDRRPVSDLLFGGNILDQLIKETSEIDIHVIRQKRRPKVLGFTLSFPKITSSLETYTKTAIYISVVGGLNYLFLPYIGYRALGFAFLLAVLPVSLLAGLGPTLLSAVMSALIWDFCFIPPQFTFAVRESQDAMMILAYFAVASVSGLLAQRLRKKERDLVNRESRARMLYEFERKLAEASTVEALTEQAHDTILKIFGLSSYIFRSALDGTLSVEQVGNDSDRMSEKDFAVAQWTFAHRKKAGKGTDTLYSSDCLCYPLISRSQTLGVLVVYPDGILPLDQENLLETVVVNLAAALERENLKSFSRRAHLLEESEKMHQTLLNSVSHELRTPLTSIVGITSALREKASVDKSHVELLNHLEQSATRLNHTVENLLDMTRLSSGVLEIEKNYFEIGDFVQGWLSRSRQQYLDHEIHLNINGKEMFVKGDEKLLDNVLTNLVRNAAFYSPKGTTIQIKIQKNQTYAEINVSDEGPGVPEDLLSKVFDRFFRANMHIGGLGLGLSISKAIVEAHKGHIFAANRKDQSGCIFSILLPTQSLPNILEEKA